MAAFANSPTPAMGERRTSTSGCNQQSLAGGMTAMLHIVISP
jgi:hypothetical protein